MRWPIKYLIIATCVTALVFVAGIAMIYGATPASTPRAIGFTLLLAALPVGGMSLVGLITRRAVGALRRRAPARRGLRAGARSASSRRLATAAR